MEHGLADSTIEERRYRTVFRRAHAGHAACQGDEWLMEPCRLADGRLAPRPLVWSRRNGPWRRVESLWVGAAPGNAGGRGAGALGAHGTRIPFGGDVAGGNLEVLLGSIGQSRNDCFIVAALNQLPERGGGEPTLAELRAPVGSYASSIHLLRDTILASGATLIVGLGNVAVRCVAAALRPIPHELRLPTIRTLGKSGLERGIPYPLAAATNLEPALLDAWREAWGEVPLPQLLWLTHPSAQNMSPFAGPDTRFHRRMRDACSDLRSTASLFLHRLPPHERPEPPTDGIYALPEWRQLIAPRHARLDRLWRQRGV